MSTNHGTAPPARKLYTSPTSTPITCAGGAAKTRGRAFGVDARADLITADTQRQHESDGVSSAEGPVLMKDLDLGDEVISLGEEKEWDEESTRLSWNNKGADTLRWFNVQLGNRM